MTTDATASGAASVSARTKSALWSLAARVRLRHLSLACVGVFYLYMLVPARVQDTIAVFRLPMPPAAAAYSLGYAYLTVIDLVMLALGGFMLILFSGRRPRGATNWSLLFYVSLCVLCAAASWVFSQLGVFPTAYWDGPLSALRVIAAYLPFAAIQGDSRARARHLQNALALLFLTSVALNLAGFANPATPSNQAGRLTASGLDFATTSYAGAALALTALTMSRGPRQVVLFAIGMIGLLMGGGRNAIVVFIPALALVTFQRYTLKKETVAAFSVAAVLLVPLAFAAPFVTERLPLLNRSLDDRVYYRQPQVLSALARSTFPYVDRIPLTDPAFVGRVNVWATSLDLLRSSHGVPLGSDWLVQQQLAPLGVPSHSHNAYLQTALKFGPLAVCLWAAWFLSAWRGLRARSPYSAAIAFLMLSLLLDYWLLVTKATFVLFAFILLDGLWLADRATRTDAPAAAGAAAS
jgi:hypothetical protein